MGECSHDCASCASKGDGSCGKAKFLAAPNPGSRVKRMVAVMSGKGGVGKSLVAEVLAVEAARRGLKTAVLDADITGPSIPAAFGIAGSAATDGEAIIPARTRGGIGVMSVNLLVEHPEDPVVWRGPVIAGAVKQFWTDVAWGDVDVMFVDMPPGTGDVPLTVFQSLPIDCCVVVTSPQDVVAMIVEKAVRMADMMKIPVRALVENMCSFTCPECGATHRLFGAGRAAETAAAHGISAVASVPIDPALAAAVDAGRVEDASLPDVRSVLDAVLA